MASLAESSLGSVPIEEIRAAQLRLNNYEQPSHDAQSAISEPVLQQHQHAAPSDHYLHVTAGSDSSSKSSTVPDSNEPNSRVPGDSLPLARNMMLNASKNMPRELLTFIGDERLATPKVMPFSPCGGDTQPWGTQEIVESSKSMIGLVQTTPQKTRSPSASTPNTYNSGLDTDQSVPISLGIGNMSPRTSQARRDFNNDTQMHDLSREDTSPTTSQVERDILRDDTQPRTQLGLHDVPATPAMAGKKHNREGELLTSATTVVITPHYTQLFQGGDKPPVMSNTQLFDANDSSPAVALPQTAIHSDPIRSRPSPNMTGSTTQSSPPFTSPVMHMQPGPASSRAPGDPLTRYKPIAESQEERRARDRFLRKRGGNFDAGDLDESLGFRTIRGESNADGLSNFKAPLRKGSRPGSADRAIELSDTVKTPITERQWNKFVDRAAGEPVVDDDDEERQLNEMQDLVQEPIVEYSERDEPPEAVNQDDNDQDDADIEDDDENDEYDEFGQTLRSQSHYELHCDDDARRDDNMELLDREETEAGIYRQKTAGKDWTAERQSAESTQLSAIADSQPTAQRSTSQRPSQQTVQYSPYMSGSQHQGKTSEEMALLYTPQASNQSRVVASQLHAEPSVETDISGDKIPSSPPLAVNDSEPIPEDYADVSIVRRDLLKQFQSHADPTDAHEIPTCDVHANQGSKAVTREEESLLLYSTARTHVSASAQSPAKPSANTPSRKVYGSQRSSLTDQSPAKKTFADFNAKSSLSKENSFGNDFSQQVQSHLAEFYTAEDQNVKRLTSDDHGESSARKRPKLGHSRGRVDRHPALKDGNFEAVLVRNAEVVAVERNSVSENAGTIPGSAPERIQPRYVEHSSSEPDSADVGRELDPVTMQDQRGTPIPPLKDSPNKANQMPTALTEEEDEKGRETTAESVRLREEAGRAAVSQLVASRRGPLSKRSKQATYGRGSRRKSSRAESTAAGRLRKMRALAIATNDDESDGSAATEAENDALDATSGHDKVTTPLDEAMSNVEQQAIASPGSRDNKAIDTSIADLQSSVTESIHTDVVVGDRVWAFFRGSPHYFYTATWLGTSPDGMTYKIKFDDHKVTNIETYHVRRLELRIGDTVKVDEPDKRKHNWVIVGFGPVATTDEQRAIGTDMFGHAHVQVQLKGNRKSLSKSTSSDINAHEVHTVPVNYLYLTTTMWPPYKTRAFEPPDKLANTRAETPSSGGKSSAGTPASRSRRAPGPYVNGKVNRTSHLRETSVASTSSASPTSIFSGMAFALSYVSTGEEKMEISRLIQRNGGTILEDGFGELFDLPDIGAADVPYPSKKSPRKLHNASEAASLQLSSKYKDLRFAALIADRHSRRAKYMQALALGLPTLSGRWVLHSLDESKNPSSDSIGPLPWTKYLLPAGESTFLNAIRSRNLAPYDATSASLAQTIESRACLLNEDGLILVAPHTGSLNWEKRKTFAFLTMACGAGHVKRVNDVQEAKKLMLEDPEMWKWVYVDTSVLEAEKVLFDNGTSTTAKSKKRRQSRVSGLEHGEEKMSATDGVAKIVNDEFVIQSLILEALVE